LGDEGAANHTRLAADVAGPGVHVFVYGRRGLRQGGPAPTRFPARQTLEASQAVSRLAGIPSERAIFAQQHPAVIDRGVFHNDVVAVGTERVLLFREEAFLERDALLRELAAKVEGFTPIEVAARELSVDDAVKSYLFNSQLVRAGADLVLIAPEECREVEPVRRWLDAHVGTGQPISSVRTFDLRQS